MNTLPLEDWDRIHELRPQDTIADRRAGPARGGARAGRLQPMRILVFNLYFHPDPTGTGLTLGELTRDLAERGHEVTVVTTVTHYGLEGPVADYDGRLILDETWEGVRVLRTQLPRFAGSPRVRRLMTYLAYMLLAIPAGMRAVLPDVVFGVLPPVTTGPAVWLMSRLRRV